MILMFTFCVIQTMSGVQEGLELPEDEEEKKKKTEADQEKFGGLCTVLLIPMASLLFELSDFACKVSDFFSFSSSGCHR